MTNPMRQLVVAGVAVALLLIVIVWMTGFFNDRITPGMAETEPAGAEPAAVVQLESISVIESIAATIKPEETTVISSRLLSRITKMNVRAGQMVRRGDLLATLEHTDLLARARQAEEQASAIQARKLEAEKNLGRARSMFEQGLMAKAELDRAIAAFDELKAAESAATMALQDAEAAVDYSEIKAPISGRVVERLAEPGDTATPGMPLLSLYNPASLQAEAQVRESLAVRLEVGQSIEIEVPSIGARIPAAIVEIVPAANPGSRSFKIKAQFELNSRLLPGMYARLLVPAGEQQVILVPLQSVSRIGQLNLVWIYQDGQRQQRLVELGDEVGDRVIVQAGLNAGDQVFERGNAGAFS